MRIDRRLLNWGLFFILLGVIPLAVRQGLLAQTSLERWWSLWPLLLVAAGIGLVLRRTPIDFAGGLLTAGTLGVMAGSVLATGFNVPSFAGCGDERAGRDEIARSRRTTPDPRGPRTAPYTIRSRRRCRVPTSSGV